MTLLKKFPLNCYSQLLCWFPITILSMVYLLTMYFYIHGVLFFVKAIEHKCQEQIQWEGNTTTKLVSAEPVKSGQLPCFGFFSALHA